VSADQTATVRYYDDLDCWVVWGDTAREALEDRRLSARTFDVANLRYLPADMHEPNAHLIETLRRWFVLLDGKEHLTARRPIQPLFSPRRIRTLRDTVHTIIETALEEFDASGTGDAAPDLANKISARTVATVLGLPDIDDATLHGWARALADFLATSYRRECAVRAQEALREMEEFIGNTPDGGDELWAGFGGDDGDRLATASMMLFGGLETTAALIGFSLWYMLGHQLQGGVAASPNGEEATAIVERVLELYAPLGHVARVAAEDTALAGHRIARDELVLVSLNGRDLFDSPALPDRPPTHHGGYRVDHVAFGHGVHYCVGAPLARLTATTALTLFARRYPDARVRDVRWRRNRTYPGFEHLYLTLTAD
jgi:cytochrome P450